MKKTAQFLLLLCMLLFSKTNFGQITGSVFRDFNSNGIRGTAVPNLEPGVNGIVVNAFNASNTIVASFVTTSTGAYSIPATGSVYNGTQGSNTGFVAAGVAVRIEFIIPTSGSCGISASDFSSSNGTGNGTSVQFASGGATNINYAINNPEDYTSNINPDVFIPQFINGNPLVAGTSQTNTWFKGFPYNTSGSGASPKTLNGTTIGSVWGVAYSKQAKKIFTSAFLKRHCGLGTLGSGGIYLLTPTATSFTAASFYDMDANGHRTRSAGGAWGPGNSYNLVGSSQITFLGAVDPLSGQPNGLGIVGTNVNRGLGASATAQNNDAAVFDQTCKVGLGDLEISDDGKFLFVMNLFSRLVFRLELNDAYNPTSVIAVTSYALPAVVVTNGVLRPFALKYSKGKVFVGALSSGENGGTNVQGGTTDMFAYVFELNNPKGSASFNATPVIRYPLNHAKGESWDFSPALNSRWHPWNRVTTAPYGGATNKTYPTPLLSNIEFSDNGAMILDLCDRSGHQYGNWNYRDLSGTATASIFVGGDIVIAGKNCGTNAYTLESNGSYTSEGVVYSSTGVGNTTGLATINVAGTGYTGTAGEFFEYDDAQLQGDNADHAEGMQGGAAVLRGDARVLTTMMDPITFNTGGTSKQSTINGVATAATAYQMYLSSGSSIDAFFNKGNGLGDIEILTDIQPIQIGNRIWIDTNSNGIQDAGETTAGVPTGTTVTLRSPGIDGDYTTTGDNQSWTTTTDATGNYYFSTLSSNDNRRTAGMVFATVLTNQVLPGFNYRIEVALPAGYQLTKTNTAANGYDNIDNDAILNGVNAIVNFNTGNTNHNFDIGFTTLASLGDKVWIDEGAGGGTAKDGLQNGTEPGVAGITVTLKNNVGAVVATTVTDAIGNYLFDNLTPADYTVGFTLPANYTITTQTNATDDNNTTGASTTGSDVNTTTGQSYTVTLSAGENNRNIDAGLVFNTAAIPNSIGNRVWLDTDAVGDQDAGEPGIAGVTVTLYAGDGVTIVATTITDANGNYLFNNLPANTGYILGFTPPAGMIFTATTGTTLGNDTDSDVEASTFSPNFGRTGFINSGVAGTAITQVDAGLIPQTTGTASLGDRVWNDLNNNGTQDAGEPGIASVTVNLYHDVDGDGVLTGGELTAIRTVATDAFGNYTFNNLTVTSVNRYQVEFIQPAGYNNTPVANNNSGSDATDSDITNNATDRTDFIILKSNERNTSVDAGFVQSAPAGTLKLGDKVWRDDNGDGQQGATEPGVPGVTVQLCQNGADGLPGTADDVLLATTSTDVNGSYLFVNLAASTTAATNYNVKFSNIPANFSFTQTDAGADATDNDANGLGKTGSINLVADNITIDAGISQGIPNGLGSLGDRVWFDLDNNGIQDAGELGAAGVTVNLFTDANGDGQITGAELTPSQTTTTNALGEYMFGGLVAGNYQVGFTLPAALSTYTLSAKDAGINDALDSDGNPLNTSIEGNTAGALTSYTNLIALATGQDKLTVDLGIVPPVNTNTLGGTAWFDTDTDGLQTANPGRVQGVVVNLYNSVGTLIATTTTDENGDYLFTGLADGDYSVAFAAYPAGFDLTTKSATNDVTGSDADRISGRTATVTLNAGNRNDRSLDGGLISIRAALGNKVWEDLNGDGIQDAGEPGVTGVTVTLYDGTSNVIATAITDDNGYYYFPNLTAGNYQVGFTTLPDGMEFTTKDNTTGPDGDGANTWTGGGDSDVNPSGASATRTDVFALAASQVNLTIDAGIRRVPIATVGNRVWDDVNGDGIQDAGEPGIAGVIAVLYNNLNQPIGSAVTDGNGLWLITNVPTGTGYYVIFTNKPIGNFTVQDNGGAGTGGAGDSDTDSDANVAGQTGTFDVTPNTLNVKIDAGITSTITLPVTLVSFTAKPQGSQAAIQWVVANQVNIAAYAVEYSSDGVNFKTIETITANNATAFTYSTADVNPASDVNYYRLRIIEANSKINYSDVKKVVFTKDGIITVWPNPVADKAVVNITLKTAQKVLFTVLDAKGSIVKQQAMSLVKGANQVTLDDLQILPKGTYLLQLISVDGNIKFVQKLVKE